MPNQMSIVEAFKLHICGQCMYKAGCQRGLYPVYDEQQKLTSVKCDSYGRITQETIKEITMEVAQ